VCTTALALGLQVAARPCPKARLRGWKEAVDAHAIQPLQQFACTTEKNATDSEDHLREGPPLHREPGRLLPGLLL
jgi:hypothetical protein